MYGDVSHGILSRPYKGRRSGHQETYVVPATITSMVRTCTAIASIVMQTMVATETIMICAFAPVRMVERSIGTSSAITTTTAIKTRARRPIHAPDERKTFRSCDCAVQQRYVISVHQATMHGV